MKVSLFVILCCIPLVLSSERPPTCLRELTTRALGRQVANRYCTPESFIEIEFKLKFGCDLPMYIDQGVRLEVRTADIRWQPIRYYTPSLTAASNISNAMSLVHLDANDTVRAMAATYTSQLPLHCINSSETVTIREYLCGRYAELLRGNNDPQMRIRWMQRFGIQAMADQATWALDDVKIKLWNGSCFVRLVDENFNNDSLVTSNRRYKLDAVTVMEPPCGELRPGASKALYFRNIAGNNDINISRRSIVIDVPHLPAEVCEVIDPNTMPASDDGEITCSTQPLSPQSVTLQCSQGGRVNCSCSGSGNTPIDGVTCPVPSTTTTEMVETTTETPPTTTETPPTTTETPPTTTEPPLTTTEIPPTTTEPPLTTTETSPTTETPHTTTEAPPTTTETPPTTTETLPTTTEALPTTTEPLPTTTEPPPTTTEPPPTTTEATPTTTEPPPTTTESPTTTEPLFTTIEPPPTTPTTIRSIEDKLGKGNVEDLLDLLNGTVVSKEVSKIIVTAATNALKALSKDGDSSAAGPVLDFLDKFALTSFNASQGKLTTDSYVLSVKEVDVRKSLTSLGSRVAAIREEEGAISLPGEIFRDLAQLSSQIRVASFIYKNLSDALPETTADGRNDSTIVSPVVSTALGCGKQVCPMRNIRLKEPVRIEIHHFEAETEENDLKCLFLDIENNVWSSEGCERNQMLSNSTYSLCECQHLTHFAILLSPGGLENVPKEHIQALEIIGYVGVGISLICMALTVFTFLFLKALWGMRTFIHINLCICLGVSQLIFVVAVDKTEIEELCQAIAIVLHYSFLTTFMWMLMEGVVLYVVLIRVFIKKQRGYIIWFTVVSYGLPALYMCLTVPLGMLLRDEQGPQYGSFNGSDACWLRYDTGFVWAYIAPVIVIILINVGFFFMTISKMYKHQKKSKKKTKRAHFSHWLKTSISLLVVMGITWIVGIMAFHQALLFFAYIFVIAIGFQGAAIFVLFVVLSKQVKEAYRNWWRKKKSGSKLLESLFSSDSDRLRSRSSSMRTSSFRMSKGTFRKVMESIKEENDYKIPDSSVAESKMDHKEDISSSKMDHKEDISSSKMDYHEDISPGDHDTHKLPYDPVPEEKEYTPSVDFENVPTTDCTSQTTSNSEVVSSDTDQSYFVVLYKS